jgi:hypothetical protein
MSENGGEPVAPNPTPEQQQLSVDVGLQTIEEQAPISTAVIGSNAVGELQQAAAKDTLDKFTQGGATEKVQKALNTVNGDTKEPLKVDGEMGPKTIDSLAQHQTPGNAEEEEGDEVGLFQQGVDFLKASWNKFDIVSKAHAGTQSAADIAAAKKPVAKAYARGSTETAPFNRQMDANGKATNQFTKEGSENASKTQDFLVKAGIPKDKLVFNSNERGTPEATWDNVILNDSAKTYGTWEKGGNSEWDQYQAKYKAYKDAPKADKPAAKKAFLDYYMKNSKHATGKALDLSIKGLSKAQQKTIMDTLKAQGYKVVDETGSKNPHIHFKWD